MIGGHYQLFFYSAWIYAAYIIAVSFSQRRSQLSGIHTVKVIIACIAAYVFAALLAAVQLLPTLEMIPTSVRASGLAPDVAFGGSLELWQLPSILLPSFPRALFFVGAALLILAIFAVIVKQDFNRLFFGFSAIACLYLSLGGRSVLYPLLYEYIPGFSLFRSPGRIMFFFSYFVIVLAVYGFQAWQNGEYTKREQKIVQVIIGIAAILSMIAVISVPLLKQDIIAYGESQVSRLYDSQPFTITTEANEVTYYQSLVPGIVESLWKDIILMASVLLVLFALSMYPLYTKGRKKSTLWTAILILLVLLQPFLYASSLVQTEKPAKVFYDSSLLDYLRRQEGVFRIASVFEAGNDAIPQQITARNGLYLVGGYDQTRLADYAEYINKINDEDFVHISVSRIKRIKQPVLLDLFNTKYIVTDKNLTTAGYSLVYIAFNHPYFDVMGSPKKLKEVYVYQNQNALPRAFMVPNAVIVKHEESLNKILSTDFDPRNSVIIEKEPTIPLNNEGMFQEVQITKYTPNKIDMKVNATVPGFLVVSEVYTPDWKAYSNGVELPVYRGDYLFRVIPISEGEQEIVMQYKPKLFFVGAGISVASWIVVILIATYVLAKKKKQPKDGTRKKTSKK